MAVQRAWVGIEPDERCKIGAEIETEESDESSLPSRCILREVGGDYTDEGRAMFVSPGYDARKHRSVSTAWTDLPDKIKSAEEYDNQDLGPTEYRRRSAQCVVCLC